MEGIAASTGGRKKSRPILSYRKNERLLGVGKSKLDQYRPEIEALMNNGSTQAFIADRYKTTEANLHHWLKQRGLVRARE